MSSCIKLGAALLLSLAILSTARATVLLEETQLVSRSTQFAQVAPTPQTFVVATAGRYSASLNDVGFPNPLTSGELVITQGVRTVLRMTQLGTMEFDATPGPYTVHVLGNGAGPGTLGTAIGPAGGAPLLTYQSGIVGTPVAADPNRSAIAASFAVTQAGTYSLTMTDRAFPAALATADLLVVAKNGTPIARACIPSNPPICSGNTASIALSVGDYDVFVSSSAQSSVHAGLLSVRIEDGGGAVYAATHPIGALTAHASVDFATAGQHDLHVTDLQFPAPLGSVNVAITQGGNLLATSVGSTTRTFTAQQGPATLYAVATAASASSVGTFGLQLSKDAQTVFGDVRAVTGSTLNTSSTGPRSYIFSATVNTPGQYRVDVRDFGFPAAIPALQTLVAQKGASLGTAGAAGRITVTAESGPMLIVVIAAGLPSANGTGLFAVSVAASLSGQEIFSTTQGVGDLFHSRSITLAKTGNFDVTVADIGFPAAFADLAVTVTRGDTLVGQIFGGGAFSFAGAPGNYSLNFIARSALTQNYGLYGFKLEDTPPLPTVNLTASPTAITTGGTTSLTWDANDATSCTASGGWSGSRATSGAATSIGPFASNTTLTLTCNGPGGISSAAANITVTAAPAATSDGGGELDKVLVLALLLVLLHQHVIRRRVA